LSVLLAVDTATESIGLALHDGAQVLAEHLWHSRAHHTVELAPEVAMMLRRAGAGPRDLRGVAVARGPGSFTGLRIGMAFAKGLALGHNLPLVAVPTFDILVYGQPRMQKPLLALVRMGRSRVAALWYKWSHDGWQAQGEPEGFTWEGLLDQVEGPAQVCGELDQEARNTLRADARLQLAGPAESARRPGFLAELGWRRLRAGEEDDSERVAPIYLRTRSGLEV
jgi:tRNA threonylcarbamoyladenosine biosynthesis protein TsaB